MSLLDLSKDIVNLVLEYLDATSRVALLSTCRFLFFDLRPKLTKDLQVDVATGKRMAELRTFLDDVSVGAGPFGKAGMTAALSFVPAGLLHRAFACLCEELSDCQPQGQNGGCLQVLLWDYLFPITAWLNCRKYCDLHVVVLEKYLSSADLHLGTQWEPLPAAVYLVLCVLDFYLPRLLGRRSPRLGLVATERKRTPFSAANLIEFGKRSLLKQVVPLPQRLDDVLCKMLKFLHPVFDFQVSVCVIDALCKEFNLLHVEPAVYGKFMSVISHGGFYRSDLDGRLRCLPFSSLKRWVEEAVQDEEEVQHDWSYVAAMAFRKAVTESELQTEHEIEECGHAEILSSFLVYNGDSLYESAVPFRTAVAESGVQTEHKMEQRECEEESVHGDEEEEGSDEEEEDSEAQEEGIVYAMPNVLVRLLLGDEGFIAQYGIVRTAGW